MCHRLHAILLALIVCSAFAAAGEPAGPTAGCGRQSLTVWAVVVGVSEYQNPGISSLKYAHRDAVEFYKLIQTPMGGSFREDHIQLLTSPPTRADDSPTGRILSAPATTANITRASAGSSRKPIRKITWCSSSRVMAHRIPIGRNSCFSSVKTRTPRTSPRRPCRCGRSSRACGTSSKPGRR